MSAQAGVWNFDGRPPSRELLANISQAIAPYGPDGESAHFGNPVGMLYRPFHTTKESRLERQPHTSGRGNVITWDGRLDNREELIPKLRDSLALEQTDVAIVAAAFERWGTDSFPKLIGDWALAIWNPIDKRLILARDYVGVRHLYYYPTANYVIWCSYLAPLLLSGDQFTLDNEYIAGYLALYPEAHITPYREIRAVPPGKFVQIGSGRITIQSYWVFNPKLRIRYKTDAEYEEHFRHVFRQAVSRRLRSDSPILAELSGGLDSSSIVCMADDIIDKGEAETPRLDTVSYYTHKEPQGDDWLYFTKVEQKRGRRGFHINTGSYSDSLSLESTVFTAIPGCLGVAEELESERRKIVQDGGYRGTLSGIGGDEFFGGVPNPLPQVADSLLQIRLIEFAKRLIAWSLHKRIPWVQLLLQTVGLLLPRLPGSHLLKGARLAPWVDRGFARRHRVADRQLGPRESLGLWLPSRRAYARTLVTMTRQISGSCPPTRVFEEKRYPFLDQDLVQFALSIPANQMLRPGERRSLMRRALAGILPPEILSRRTKGIAARCYMAALNADWPIFESLFESPLSWRLGYIERHRFQSELLATKQGKQEYLVSLLKVISLELWLRELEVYGLVREVKRPIVPVVPASKSPTHAQGRKATLPDRCLRQLMLKQGGTNGVRQAAHYNIGPSQRQHSSNS